MSIHSQNTSTLMKHVGVYNDKRCAIVLQLPEEPDFVHVVETESLPDQVHQNVMDIIASAEAQAEQWLGNVLARKMLYDGTNALRSLYERGYVQTVPIEKVFLAPRPSDRVPLKEVLAHLRSFQNPNQAQPTADPVTGEDYSRIVAEEQAKLDEAVNQEPAEQPVHDPSVEKHNQHLANLTGDASEQNKQIAANLVAEAELLEAEAVRKRRQAEQIGSVVSKQRDSGDTNAQPTPQVQENTEGGPWVDPVTGRSYKNEAALKGAITRREKAASGS